MYLFLLIISLLRVLFIDSLQRCRKRYYVLKILKVLVKIWTADLYGRLQCRAEGESLSPIQISRKYFSVLVKSIFRVLPKQYQDLNGKADKQADQAHYNRNTFPIGVLLWSKLFLLQSVEGITLITYPRYTNHSSFVERSLLYVWELIPFICKIVFLVSVIVIHWPYE